MTVAVPPTIADAVDLLRDEPDAMLLAGGTDAMVEINEGHRRPDSLVVALNRIPELRAWRHDPAAGTVTIGAAVTYTELIEDPVAELVPALAEASRTVGSPQIRNAGTLGGNLGTCSPAGDGLPVLSALGATIRLVSASGERSVPVDEFMTGVKRNDLAPGELIADVTVPVVDGWQGYAKVGVRNAMVIAVASSCVVVDRANGSAAIALGSVGPTVLRCTEAEEVLVAGVPGLAPGQADEELLDRVADLAAAAATPITDHRSTAAYRRHAVRVLTRRLLRRAFADTGSDVTASGSGGGR